MTRIQRLDDDAVGQIAAGEVVTRPADVVKELVENSLDAGATEIEVAVERGGTGAIRVSDDGRGMVSDDARRAFERHATSKIGDADDLRAVETLGFRGEALAAIAEAATVELTTKAPGEEAVTVDPGGQIRPAARGVGTTVTVTDLFGGRPARRESLSSPAREFSRVSDVVARYALLWPSVGVSLDHDGNRVFATPGSGDVVDAILGVYDREVAGAATTFDTEVDGVGVRGAVCRPSVTRANPGYVHVAVNGRALDDRTIPRAVEQGYGRLLPGDRHPIAVVSVAVDPADVDVNVHPAKTEVAFREQRRVTDAVASAVQSALATADLSRSAEVAVDVESSLAPVEASGFDEWAVVGTFRDLYVLCEADDELLVIDGHAAHERINFERLSDALDEGIPSTEVDPPATLSLAPELAALLDDGEVRGRLRELGFRASTLGDGTVRVSGVPAPLGRSLDPGAIADVLSDLRTGEDVDLRGDLLADLACHPSLKAGDDFDGDTARRLVDRLGECDQPYACPHGRPTVLSLSEATLARGFEREGTRLD